jgi:hypothetical protein
MQKSIFVFQSTFPSLSNAAEGFFIIFNGENKPAMITFDTTEASIDRRRLFSKVQADANSPHQKPICLHNQGAAAPVMASK